MGLGARILTALLLTAPAHAADGPVLGPDRPGLGESGQTPGPGYVVIEAAVAGSVGSGPVAVGTQGIRLRLGVDEGVEARVVLPDLVASEAGITVGPLAIGGKVAGHASDKVTLSGVPELLIGLDGGAVGWRLSANTGLDLDRVGVWLNATTTVLDGVTVLGGGGIWVTVGGGGLYVNAGREVVGGSTLIGGGGWWGLSETAQIDAGCDLFLVGDEVVAVPMLGTSLAF